MSTDWFTRTRIVRPPWAVSTMLALAIPLGVTSVLTASTATGAGTANSDTSLACGAAQVSRQLATGSAWRMCARVDVYKGLVLEQVQFRPATGAREFQGWLPVIDSLYLAQLVVPYDTGTSAYNDITDYGFGNHGLLPQTTHTCGGDTLPIHQSYVVGFDLVERTIPGVCLEEINTGLSWHAREQSYRDNAPRYGQQGRAFEVSSISKVSWYEYQQKVTFTDQGEITVGLGATGDLAPDFFVDDPATTAQVGPPHSEGDNAASGQAASHWHNAVFRVDFGIDSGKQEVEQWDYLRPDPVGKPARVEGTGRTLSEAFAADPDSDPQTWWRVLNPTSLNPDGHARSYEIVNNSIQNPYDPLTRPKVSFTNNHACQEYASHNLNAGCPNLSVPDYVAQETEPLTDPVAWVNVGFHHIARDEDQSPMPVHWQSFTLTPRNLLAQQATTPIERSCINGGPVSLYGSCAAINAAAPTLTPATEPASPGTLLSSSTGTWLATRGVLSFQRIWLRDGHPITSVGPNGLEVTAGGTHYRVTDADQGHRISVRVIASASGVVPGSADSAALAVRSRVATSAPPATTLKKPSKFSARVIGKKKRYLVVRVTGSAARGTVRFQRGSWQRKRTVVGNRVRVALPAKWRARNVKVKVTYSGDTKRQARTMTLRIPKLRR